jgi:hypothetical protein
MELVAVFPTLRHPDVVRTLDLAGYRWKALASPRTQHATSPPRAGAAR